MRALPTLPALLFPLALQAAPELEQNDMTQAQSLHDKSCLSCHQRMYGGDGSLMYTRDGRMLSDKAELLQRVSACNAQANAGWFPEEEALVANYLNQRYYHFNQ